MTQSNNFYYLPTKSKCTCYSFSCPFDRICEELYTVVRLLDFYISSSLSPPRHALVVDAFVKRWPIEFRKL